MDLLVFILSLGHSKRIKVEPFTYICFCGGVKPRPTIEAQEHRFIKSTPEEEKSLGHHVGNTGA